MYNFHKNIEKNESSGRKINEIELWRKKRDKRIKSFFFILHVFLIFLSKIMSNFFINYRIVRQMKFDNFFASKIL